MRGNANCSEMVMTLQTIVLYLTRLALLLERYIQRPDCLLCNSSKKEFSTSISTHLQYQVQNCIAFIALYLC